MKKEKIDYRLEILSNHFQRPIKLFRKYLKKEYEVILKDNKLHFNNEEFTTPNLFYNKGLVKLVKGYNGQSGNNELRQFEIAVNNERVKLDNFFNTL